LNRTSLPDNRNPQIGLTCKLLILGAGYIGTHLANTIPGASIEQQQIQTPLDISQILDRHQPTNVVNCIGRTGVPNIDWCEGHPDETWFANTIVPTWLVRECSFRGIHVIQVSTACLFEGNPNGCAGWDERGDVVLSSTYAHSKYAAERIMLEFGNTAIVRIRLPFGPTPHPRNLFDKLISFDAVVDAENSMTSLCDLTTIVRTVANIRLQGILHATNPGSISYLDIVPAMCRILQIQKKYRYISPTELISFGIVKTHRTNCLITSCKLGVIVPTIRPIKSAIIEDLIRYRRFLDVNHEA
jgi:dTDP-4-dehydrorhamnose reductase